MDKICLVCTLGNRDIQFKKEHKEHVEKILDIELKNNRDNNNYLVIDPDSFKPTTQKILDNFENIQKYISMPMINKILEKYNNNINKIYLIATDQKNAEEKHCAKDTIFEGEIVKKLLSKKYENIYVEPANFNAKDMESWFKLFNKLFNKVFKNNDKIVIEFSGGVGETREAIRLASLFNNNIETYEVINNELKSINSGFYEKQIIKEKIKDLINNYNYSAALYFKEYIDTDTIKLIEHLKYRLNFDFENAKKNYSEKRLIKLTNEKNAIKKLEYLILELLDNMEIELKNENYANFLGRVYRLEEAMGQYFVLKWLKDNDYTIKYPLYNNRIYFRKPENISEREISILNKILGSFINETLSNNNTNNNKLRSILNNIIDKNSTNYRKYKFGYNLDTGNYYDLINEIYNNNNKIVKEIYASLSNMHKYYDKNNRKHIILRNNTIIAHGFKGVSERILNNTLYNNNINSNIYDYFIKMRKEFYEYVNNENTDIENIFNKINKEIISNL